MNFKNELIELLSSNIEELDKATIEKLIETPKDPKMGNFAFPCFSLAKAFKKAPNMIAEELKTKLSSELFEKIENVGPYLNFTINKETYLKQVLNEVFTKKDKFGYSNIGKEKNVIVEFSSPNIAKPFHIGHLRTTMIGNAINNIYKALGYNTTSVNHLGDYGKQFGLLITAYKAWGDRETIEKDPINELLKLYVHVNQEIENDPSIDDTARAWFKKLEDGDKEAHEIWEWIREVSLAEFKRVYDMLGVDFDSYAGESFYSDKMPAVLKELREKKIVKEDNGAEIVDFESFGENLPTALITKSDGSSLYITRDMAAAIYRKNTYKFEKNIYVVGSEQSLHFKQWIKTLDLMGKEWANDCVHVGYGLIHLAEGKMSTRKGTIVKLEDVLNKSIEKTLEIINDKNPNLPNKELVAKQVGVGAIVFQDLFNNRIKDYTFDWDKTLSFEGESGPYVQYTHARACSILRKFNDMDLLDINYSLIKDDEVINIINILSKYETTIIQAGEKLEPYIITRFSAELAKAFNKFYHDYSISDSDEETKRARLSIVYAVKTVLKSSLALIGVEAPEEM
ncbi:MAG: arginine--tRNA ligase [Clostridia bacterium]|jgi:arginyl-tRNA synthetase|nr:arginine--tRNA ligase [Clostridia bacterium]